MHDYVWHCVCVAEWFSHLFVLSFVHRPMDERAGRLPLPIGLCGDGDPVSRISLE